MEMSSGRQVIAEAVTFPFGSAQREAYLARPAGDGPFPGLVVIHEIYGLNDNIREVTRRFADEGYEALAVDLFAGRNRALCMARIFGQLIRGSRSNASLDELRAALSFVANQPGVNPDRLGAIGFCMGGSFAIAWACTDVRLRAIAPFYAMNPRPLDAVRRACPVVGSYPESDFTTDAGRKLDAKLAEYGIEHDIKIYPGAQHSFFNDQGPHYNAPAATDAWERVLAFFEPRLRQA